MRKDFYSKLLSIFLIVLALACKSKQVITPMGSTEYGVYSVVVPPSPNLSQDLKSIIDNHRRVSISFLANEYYQMEELVIHTNHHIEIKGNGATLQPKTGRGQSTIMTFVDPKVLHISDLIIDGKYKEVDIDKHLVKIHTPAGMTNSIILDNVTIQNGDNGGLMIHNIYPLGNRRDYSVGSDKIVISNCNFNNVGKFAAINIRGSHKDVRVSNCVGSDPLSRLHFAMGKMFAVSAEVAVEEDCVGKVVFENCTIKNSNGGLFAQQVKDLRVKKFKVDSLGHNPVYYPNTNKKVGVVAFKIDDLGKGNKVSIDSFIVTNTAMLEYRVFLALEESEKMGHTSGVHVKYFESDVPIRLGASGGHSVTGGKIYDASINFISPNNQVSNVDFYGTSDNVGVRLLNISNSIKDCDFYDSKIINYKQAKSNLITNCHLRRAELINKWVIFDQNNPANPNELTITNCSAIEGVEGVWSGGIPKQSKNLKLNIISSPSLAVSNNITKNARVRRQ